MTPAQAQAQQEAAALALQQQSLLTLRPGWFGLALRAWCETAKRQHVPAAYSRACREAFRRVRRDVWSERESRLVAKWESYG